MRTIHLSASELFQVDESICCSACQQTLDDALDDDLWAKSKRRYLCPSCATLEDVLPSTAQRRASEDARAFRALDRSIVFQRPTAGSPSQEREMTSEPIIGATCSASHDRRLFRLHNHLVDRSVLGYEALGLRLIGTRTCPQDRSQLICRFRVVSADSQQWISTYKSADFAGIDFSPAALPPTAVI